MMEQSKTCTERGRSIQNRKWAGIFAIALTFAFGGAVADAQQEKKVPRIGLLSPVSPSDTAHWHQSFRQGLGDLGWVEGKNISIEYRYAEGRADRLPELAADLVRLKVDIIVAASATDALAAKSATRAIPIVMASAGDPVASGLVESLARPGGNVTGLSQIAPELAGKRLELLKEIVPKLSRVAVLWTPRQSELSWKESQHAGRELGLQIHSMEVSSADQFDNAFKEAIKAGSAALAVTPNPVVNSNRKAITELAAKHRLPAIYPDSRWADADGLMSYGADLSEPYKRVASMIDKILKGTKPADIPVEQPTRFEFMINLKAAKQIGLTIPPNVLARANKVIK